MVLGAKQSVPRTKRDVYIRRHPNGGSIMKKKLAIIAMIVLLCTALVLCACDDTDKDGDGNGTPVACNCPNCHDGVCGCDQCKGDTTIPEINRAEVKIGKDATYYSGSDNQEFSAVAYYVFEPKYTSDYTIAWDKNVAELKINGTPIALNEEQKSVKRRLVGGQKYEIDASMGKFSLAEYPITLSVTPEDYQTEVSLTKDEEYIVRMPKNANKMQIATISFGENVLIKQVFECNDGNLNYPEPSGVYYYMTVSNELNIGIGHKEYYFVIGSSEHTQAKCIAKDAEVQKVYLNQKTEIAIKANTVYYIAFINDYAGQSSTTARYIMNIYDNETASGRALQTSMFMYDESGDEVQISRFVRDSYYEFTVVDGTFYIMLYATDKDKTITIEIVERTDF